MFDDLHDPDPPSPDLATLATVSARARRLRRRRSVAVGAGFAVLLVATVAVIVQVGDGGQRRIVTVDTPPVDSTVASVPAPTPSPSSTPSSTPSAPSSVQEPPTTDATTVPGTVPCSVSVGPVWLSDGVTNPGPPQPAGLRSRWGEPGDGSITEWADGVDSEVFDRAAAAGLLASAGRFRAAVAANDVGTIDVVVDDGGCWRRYSLDDVTSTSAAFVYASRWVAALSVFDQMVIADGPDGACVEQAVGERWCVSIPADGRPVPDLPRPVGDVDGLELINLVVPEGWHLDRSSSLVRSQAIGSSGWRHIVDVGVEYCGLLLDSADVVQAIVGRQCDADAGGDRPTVAIDANGDAVVIDGTTPTVVYDGTDPDDPLPSEGERVLVDGVAVVPGTSNAIVSLCCEPVPGGRVQVDLATGAETPLGFGHQAMMLPDGTSMVWNAGEVVQLGDTAGNVAAQLGPFDPTTGTIVDLAVVDRGDGTPEVLVLVAGPEGTYLWRVFAAGGDMQLSTKVSDATWTDPSTLSLAGWGADRFFVLDRSGVLDAYDAETLAPINDPHPPVEWLSAWLTPTAQRYVTSDRRLLVDDVQVPGDYLWVR